MSSRLMICRPLAAALAAKIYFFRRRLEKVPSEVVYLMTFWIFGLQCYRDSSNLLA